MPPRLTPLITGHYYHVFNRTIDNKKLFADKSLAGLFLHLLSYYRSDKIHCSYSYFRRRPPGVQLQIFNYIQQKKYHKIMILAYCLMPNHFHLLVKQQEENAISKYISDVLNSFTRYYNILHKRKGPLFLPRFQAKHIKSREQLIHVSRYIHLNPFSSSLVALNDLHYYEWSSFREYLTQSRNNLADTSLILSQFGKDAKQYESFVLEHAHHQKMLEYIKYSEKWSK